MAVELTPNGWIALLVTLGVFIGLQRRRGAPSDLLFISGLVIVTLFGVLPPEEALAGFANPAVLTIGALFAVAAGLRSSGVLDWVGHWLLGKARDENSALRRLSVSVVGASAFIANTPLVAMLVPVVVDWCRKRQISPSRLLIPLSYLTILGGVCTLIGTSTTLIVNGLLRVEQHSVTNAWSEEFREQLAPMGLFEIGQVGLPCALVGAIFLVLFARKLLPNRTELIEQLGEQRREYLVEMLVQPECRLIGKTVEEAGLRHLPGLFLIEIDHENELITPVTPENVIHVGDRLVFTGVVSTIVDLEKIPGLVPAADLNYEFGPEQRQQRHLTEVVLSRTSPLIGTTVREANFRQRYNAAVVAVHRNGVRLTNKIGNIALEPGDTLLLQTSTEFVSTFRNSRDFYLVSSVEGSTAVRHDRAPLAIALFVLLIAWLSISSLIDWKHVDPTGAWSGFSSTAMAAITIMGLMIFTRCLPIANARVAVDLQVLVTIAAALGLGRALTRSGAAQWIANLLVQAVGDHPYILLIVIYLMAMIFTEMISNNAVPVMLFPLAVAVAWNGHYNPRPFIMAVTLAASLSFVTPIGYQTNLMVMGPGGYHPRDYLRAGWPLALLMMITALLIIPQVWPF